MIYPLTETSALFLSVAAAALVLAMLAAALIWMLTMLFYRIAGAGSDLP